MANIDTFESNLLAALNESMRRVVNDMVGEALDMFNQRIREHAAKIALSLVQESDLRTMDDHVIITLKLPKSDIGATNV